MTEQELNVFLDLEWNCAVFFQEEASVSALLSPKQWAHHLPTPGTPGTLPLLRFHPRRVDHHS